jgi:hypothetical protein
MTALQLKKLLARAALSQVGAARALDISDRNMRRYIAGELPIPRVVKYALLHLIETQDKESK